MLKKNNRKFMFFFSSRRRHTRLVSDWSSDVCSSDLVGTGANQIVQLNASGELPIVDGSNLTNLTETGEDRKSVV